MSRTACAAAILLVAGCYESHAPEIGEGAVLTDLDPDPRVVEVDLVAEPAEVELLPGTRTAVWAYRDGARPDARGSVPGPRLEAGAGDQVIVHFRNELPVETTIHWHGIRLDASMDGTPSSQLPVPPGGTFEYRFQTPDAGLFWFHPHIDSETQIERGLYATLLVRGDDEPVVDRERVLVLDDVKIEADGRLSEQTTPLDLMMGRMGNVLLVNGRREPGLTATAGALERWRVLDVANGRFFRLSLPGAQFTVIGTDGGLRPSAVTTDDLLLAPGERYDVLVRMPPAAGARIELQNLHHDRGHDLPDPGPKALATFTLEAAVSTPAADVPSGLRDVPRLAVDESTTTRRFVLSEIMEGDREPEFFINGEKWPDVTHVMVEHGATEIWEIVNEAEMDHPFHLHGMFFEVLDRDGVPEDEAVLKDTVIVPMESTLRFAVRYDAPGMWMYHCHILEHAERGMMGHLMVGPAAP